jgi:F0F1-type ATP synthase membrane subunit b/b'
MPSDPVLTREELKDHLETIEGHVRQMTEEATQKLEEMREDRASFRAELREDLSGMREDRAGSLDELREDRASFKTEVSEELDRIRRDVTRTLWISFGLLSVFVTAITFLALHLAG